MTVRLCVGMIGLAAALGANPAPAQVQIIPIPVVDPGPAPDRPIELPSLSAPLIVDGLILGGQVTDHDLAEKRGGRTIVVGSQTMTAITTGNVLNGDYAAGAVNLSDNALSNFNGIGNLLINTGAQVSLQTGMNLVINLGD